MEGSAAQRRLAVVAGHLRAGQASPSARDVSDGVTTGRCSSGRLLEGKVAVITGAGQGIGEAAALLFATHGAAVVVGDLDGERAERVAAAIQAAGGRAVAVAGDVTDPRLPKRLVDAAEASFGGLHVLVNNAGFTWDGVVHKMGDAQFQAMLDVHCTAPFRLCREAARLMRDAGKREVDGPVGAPSPRFVINVSSVSGTHGSAGQANYSTAKMGVVGLTKALAREWGRYGVRCNAIAYGKVATRLTQPKEGGAAIKVGGATVPLGIPAAMLDPSLDEMLIPLGRPGTVQEAAGAMLLLASPLASYITGQVLEVNGGMYM